MEIFDNSLHQTSSPGSNKLNLVEIFSSFKIINKIPCMGLKAATETFSEKWVFWKACNFTKNEFFSQVFFKDLNCKFHLATLRTAIFKNTSFSQNTFSGCFYGFDETLLYLKGTNLCSYKYSRNLCQRNLFSRFCKKNVELSSAKVKRSIVLTKTLTLLKKTFVKLSFTTFDSFANFYCENKFLENL